jgi:hypothetical protein
MRNFETKGDANLRFSTEQRYRMRIAFVRLGVLAKIVRTISELRNDLAAARTSLTSRRFSPSCRSIGHAVDRNSWKAGELRCCECGKRLECVRGVRGSI